MKPVNVEDYRRLARRRLPRVVYDYLEGGAEDEIGLARNLAAFADRQFLPRKLVNVSERSSECMLWDRTFAMPVYLSPTGLNAIFRPGADAMLARAAGQAGIPFALSTASNMSIEEIADAGDGEKWFQLYVIHRDIADKMCDRALVAGYEALILTVDVPVNGYRERDMRNGFGTPIKYTPRAVFDGVMHPGWSFDFLRNGVPVFKNFTTLNDVSNEAKGALMRREMDASLDIDFLSRLRDRWPKKLIVKGISRPDDAVMCAEVGADAVILSNHGARQLDSVAPALESVASSVERTSIPVFVDGGVRRGADVLKAICLGAKMVGLGRAVLYAVAANGETGVDHSLSILKEEIDRAQAMLGAPRLDNLSPDLIFDKASRSSTSPSRCAHANCAV